MAASRSTLAEPAIKQAGSAGPHWRERVVVAYIDEPPFAAPGAAGQAVGSDIELARIVLQAIGVKHIETRLTTFAELIPGVMAGRWHVNVPLFVTKERADLVAFSRPVWALRDGLIVLAGNPEGLHGYRSIAAIVNARLGVITGQVQHQAALLAGVPQTRITQFETQHAAVQALLAGTIDAYASTALGNRTFVRQVGDAALLAIEGNDDRNDNDPPKPAPAIPVGAFSFAQNAVELRARFDAHLAHYLGSADHRQRMALHGLSATEIDPIVVDSHRAP